LSSGIRQPFSTFSVTLSTFEDVDHENEQNLDQELKFDQLFTVSGAITYLVDHVMTSDKDALLAFFAIHGINDIDDFMCFTDIDFKQTYSVTSDPDIPITLSTMLVKILLSFQSWYGNVQQEYHGDTIHLFYSLTTESLILWRRINSLKSFDLSTPPIPTATTPTPPVVPSSTPAPASSRFWHSININISDYPKLMDETQWRVFVCQLRSTAASHNTIDILTPNYVPPIHDLASFQDKNRFMNKDFTNIIHTTKGKHCVQHRWMHRKFMCPS
jgi:hypothetical protein